MSTKDTVSSAAPVLAPRGEGTDDAFGVGAIIVLLGVETEILVGEGTKVVLGEEGGWAEVVVGGGTVVGGGGIVVGGEEGTVIGGGGTVGTCAGEGWTGGLTTVGVFVTVGVVVMVGVGVGIGAGTGHVVTLVFGGAQLFKALQRRLPLVELHQVHWPKAVGPRQVLQAANAPQATGTGVGVGAVRGLALAKVGDEVGAVEVGPFVGVFDGEVGQTVTVISGAPQLPPKSQICGPALGVWSHHSQRPREVGARQSTQAEKVVQSTTGVGVAAAQLVI